VRLLKFSILTAFLSGLFLCQQTFAVVLTPQKISLRNGENFELNLPEDYEIIPAAQGLGRVRFFAKAPDGRIFVADTYNMSDNSNGTIYILDGWNAKTGKFEKITPYLKNLHIPNSVQFYTDEKGQDWIYIAEVQQLTRRKFTRGETEPTDSKPQVLATFPDYGLAYKYGSWHLTRTIAFSPDGKLYVSIGTSCNSCVEKKKEKDVRGVILEMKPNGDDRKVFVRNIRNAVGIKWLNGKFYASVEGVDHLGIDKPDETFYELQRGADYGWANCVQVNGRVEADPQYIKKKNKKEIIPDCSFVPASYAYFPAHSSALGFDYFDETTTNKALNKSLLMALHGSTNRADGRGYKIVTVRDGNVQEDFITGFLKDNVTFGRPCDIMRLSQDSFLFSDDYTGTIYLVREKPKPAPKPIITTKPVVVTPPVKPAPVKPAAKTKKRSSPTVKKKTPVRKKSKP
jgi:glucose/arabinose dehydrogenase